MLVRNLKTHDRTATATTSRRRSTIANTGGLKGVVLTSAIKLMHAVFGGEGISFCIFQTFATSKLRIASRTNSESICTDVLHEKLIYISISSRRFYNGWNPNREKKDRHCDVKAMSGFGREYIMFRHLFKSRASCFMHWESIVIVSMELGTVRCHPQGRPILAIVLLSFCRFDAGTSFNCYCG
jgi:hypothetical protein